MGEQRTGQPRAEAGAAPLEGGTLGFLLGDWNVTRSVSDFRSGRSGSFRGQASFVPVPREPDAAAALRAGAGGPELVNYREPELVNGRGPELVNYREEGEFRFGAHRGPAFRSLIYRARPDGGADVRFADGREFFRLDLTRGSCQADHPCREDSYHVTVTRLGPDSFTETWRVTGPDKDYEMTATYTRARTGTGRAA